MLTQLIILSGQTVFFWLLAIFFYNRRERWTLIPLYSYLALMTLLTHNLTDLGFAISYDGWLFLIGSLSFFTTLMFITMALYLFEGPRAGRYALWTILATSAFYIGIVYLLGLQADTSAWAQLTSASAWIYFWSILAIIIDVILLAFFWELLSKIKFLPLVIRVFIVIFGVLLIDTLIFTTGAFWSSPAYQSILSSNIVIRFFLSLIGAPIMASLLKIQGFSEEAREKPKNFWEIINFRSDLETKITTLEETLARHRELEKKFNTIEETYQLAISGTGAAIWDWDLVNDKITWSPRFFEITGYDPKQVNSRKSFDKMVHPDDWKLLESAIIKAQKSGERFDAEYRFKMKSGEYRWLAGTGIIKFDSDHKPIRMVGSIIDINEKKSSEEALKKRMEEISRINSLMVGRELKMVKLKKELASNKGK